MRTQLEKILKELKKESQVKYFKKIKEELKEVLGKIRQALEMHPELTPSGRVIAQRRKRKGELAGMIAPPLPKADEGKEEEKTETEERAEKTVPSKVEGQKEKIVLPKPEIIKRIKLKQLGLSVALVSLGEEGPEAMSVGNLIYINSDHPLYQNLFSKKEQFKLHLLRLITQEIVLMKKLRLTAKEAFEWQGKLLTDAICGKAGHQTAPD